PRPFFLPSAAPSRMRLDRQSTTVPKTSNVSALTFSIAMATPSCVVVVGGLVVGAEQVHAEIVPRIVPDRMDVVGAILRVVVLDQERRAVQPVVVRLSGIDGAGPREAHVLGAGVAHPAKLLVGDVTAHVARVGLDQPQSQGPRLGTELAEPEAGRSLQ